MGPMSSKSYLAILPLAGLMAGWTTLFAGTPSTYSWGSEGSGVGQFYQPEEIAISVDRFVYVADGGNRRIQKFTLNGEFVSQFGNELLARATAVTTDALGNVYASDRIHICKFSNVGTLIMEWGLEGSGPGEFNDIEGLATDGGGNLYVADRGNDSIQKFSQDGEFLAEWTASQLTNPHSVTCHGEEIYVANDIAHIYVFTLDGLLLRDFPTAAFTGEGISVGWDGTIYVASAGVESILVFGADGNPRPIGHIGWGLQTPTGVALLDGTSVFVAEYNGHRVTVYEAAVPVQSITWGRIKTAFAPD